MQKKLLIAFVAATFTAGLNVNSFAAENQSAIVNFEGRIVDTACEIGTDLNGAAVQLGTYPTIYFNDTRTHTDNKGFNIVISKCRLTTEEGYGDAYEFPVDRVRLTFHDDGNNSSGRTERNGVMFLTDSDVVARNVGIRVQYQAANKEYVDVFQKEASSSYTVSQMNYIEVKNGIGEAYTDNTAFEYNIPMQAHIARVNQNPVGSGNVNGQMTITMSYE